MKPSGAKVDSVVLESTTRINGDQEKISQDNKENRRAGYSTFLCGM